MVQAPNWFERLLSNNFTVLIIILSVICVVGIALFIIQLVAKRLSWKAVISVTVPLVVFCILFGAYVNNVHNEVEMHDMVESTLK